MKDLLTSLRLTVVSLVLCSVVYPLLVLGFAQAAAPGQAEGSLVRDERGQVLGSRLIAQGFSRPEYLWPRPSAVDYNAAGAGGSNLSPAGSELARLVEERLARLDLPAGVTAPAELVTASGSGLDPDVSLAGALVQAPRIAAARGWPTAQVEALLRQGSRAIPGCEQRLVNVLAANLALDRER